MRFYCFYCDANSDVLICKRCGHTGRPFEPLKDAYYKAGFSTPPTSQSELKR